MHLKAQNNLRVAEYKPSRLSNLFHYDVTEKLYQVRTVRFVQADRSLVSQDVRGGDAFVLIQAEGEDAEHVAQAPPRGPKTGQGN